jgi:CubicO group peptidase (beta-lactamase class C family)
MSEMASKASGRPLDEYAAELLFGPIGIRDYFWKDAPEGFKDAGLGAWMALLSERARRRADDLAREVAHLSLADHPQFQRMFIGAIRFPEAID